MLHSLLLVVCGLRIVSSLKLSECRVTALGMENGAITDMQLSASSSFDVISVGPQNARIRKELASGAWCPKPQIKSGSYEFLEVDLGQVYLITGIETQGRYGNGTGREYTTQYAIEYLRLNSPWIRYHNRSLAEVMDGNEDTANAIRRDLDPPIVASRIRIIPHSAYPRTMCLRVEFYGCSYNEGLMFYSMNNDGSRIDSYDFRDKIFEKSDMLSHFTETRNGSSPPRLYGSLRIRKKAASTVSSKRNGKGLGLLSDGVIGTSKPLDDTISDEDSISPWIGWNQLITNGSVEIIFEFVDLRKFAYVEIWTYGTSLRTTEIFFSTDGKKFSLSSQISSIQRRPADAARNLPIRIPLHNGTGIALKMKLSFREQWLFLSEVYFSSSTVKKVSLSTRYPVIVTSTTTTITTTATTVTSRPGTFNATASMPAVEESTYVFPVVYFISLVLLFLLISCAMCGILISRRRGPKPKDYNAGKAKIMVTSLGEKGFCTDFYDESEADYHQIQDGGFYADEKKLASVGKRSKKTPSWSDFHFPPPPPDMYSANESSVEPLLMPQIPQIPSSPPPPPIVSTVRRLRDDRTWPKKNGKDDSLHYAASAVRTINGKVKRRLERFSTDRVLLGPELGRGRLTMIRSCCIAGSNYAAKMITDTNQQALSVLNDETKILSKIDHENVIRLYGISDDATTMYLELAHYGNVRQYLAHRPDSGYLNLLRLVIEIAAGMKYLEQKQIVHGHLSPQCILVNHNETVKIASPRGHLHHAQLRYSAPESVIANEWSNKSDVWSFAVTAWEIFNACTVIPFAELTNAQLIENARQIYEQRDAVYLDIPLDIPQQVTNLLVECWQARANDRPTFLEIHYILSMKNSGLQLPQNGNGATLRSIAT